MSLRWLARMWLRSWRAAPGRFAFLIACLATGVAGVVGVAALSTAIEQGLAARSRELLGGDLAVEGRTTLPDVTTYLDKAARAALRQHVEVCVLSSVVRNARGQSRLAELKAVSAAEYPLVGALQLTPQRPLAELLQDDTVLVARTFLDAHELALGDTLYVGGEPFRVAGVVEREPDPMTASFVFGPRVLLTRAGLERTQLLGLGTRVRYRSLLRFDPRFGLPALEASKRALEHSLPGGGSYVRVETHADAQPTLRTTLDRARQFLGLVALLSLLIAAAGVAQMVSAWLTQVSADTAILRCLGLRPRDVLRLYALQIVLFAAIGSVLGAAFGALVPYVLAGLYPELLPPHSLSVPWLACVRGLALGVGVALLFSLGPLLSLWQVPPARVLRADAEPLPTPRGSRVTTLVVLLAGVWLAAWLQVGAALPALAFTGALLMAAGCLWLAARGLLRLVARLPRSALPALFWHGAAALLRPGAGLVASSVALGMGNLVVLTLGLVQGVMTRELVHALPADAPSVFMMDIQTDQWPDVQREADAAGATQLQRVPVIMARLSAVDGLPVEQLVRARAAQPQEQERERWAFTREQRITSLRELPDNNHVIAGALWQDPSPNEISVEAEFARDIGARLGSRLRFDVQGVPVDFVVTSLRRVEWRRFAVSFFLVAEPGSLAEAPQFLLGAARVPKAREQALQDRIAQLHPNISFVRVRDLLERAAELMGQLGIALRALGLFGVIVGSIMLAGAVAAGQLRRAREVALLKTLGLTRLRVAALFAVEYALLGLVSGLVSAAAAYGLTALLARVVLQLSVWPALGTCLLGALGLSVLALVAGLLASVRALQVSPMTVLRDPT